MEAIRRERLGLVDWLRQLSPSDWNRPSLCAGWTVKHVVAHLVTPFEVSVPAFALSIARHRGVDRAMYAAARRIADNYSPDELVSVLEANAGSAWHPPRMPMVAPLTDVACHSADIRWALEERAVDWGDPTRLRPVLDFLTDPGRAHISYPRTGFAASRCWPRTRTGITTKGRSYGGRASRWPWARSDGTQPSAPCPARAWQR